MMNDKTNIIILFGLIALGLYTINANAAYVSGDAPPMLPPPDSGTLDEALAEVQMQPDANSAIAAFLAMIRRFESNGDYFILYGGGHFSDTSQHPNVRVPFFNPRTGRQDYSTAAGAYQINKPTYDTFAPRLGITDFSPASQDMLAYTILNSVGADVAIANNDLVTALALASKKWASLPGSSAQQNPQTLQTALDTYQQYLTQQG